MTKKQTTTVELEMVNPDYYRRELVNAGRRVARTEKAWRAAVEDRDALIAEAHGEEYAEAIDEDAWMAVIKPLGYLSYEEIRECVGIARSRVRQIIEAYRRARRD